MKYILYLSLLYLVFPVTSLSAQNNGSVIYYNTQMPLTLPDLYNGSVTLLISDAANDTLGQNGQGVCRVYLSLKHDFISDLTVVLTAPNGQSISLIGPTGYFDDTHNSTWNVAFTACNAAAQPDPGKSATWSSYEFWGSNKHYTGTYYPFGGCLEQLTGPVNGAWTLTITDNEFQDAGILNAFGIEFCDSTAIIGNGCAANAGNLSQPDMIRCIDSNLDLYLPPSYATFSLVPSAALYDYTYTISRTSDDVLLGYNASSNLTGLDTGAYTVCGFSYPADADSLLPVPNNTLTVAQMRTLLNSGFPPFCGDITGNCVNVIINAKPPNVIVTDTICAPQCVNFYGSTYCSSGTYVKNLTQNGCSYSATLKLTVIYPFNIYLRDTICAGQCSMKPGFENACSTGLYTRILPAIPPHRCDTIVRLNLLVLNPVAEIIAPTTLLHCTMPSILLTSAPVSGSHQKIWQDLSTGLTKYASTYSVTHPGLYTLTTIKKSSNGLVVCSQSDTILITAQPNLIPVTALGGIIGCGDSSITLQSAAVGQNLHFNWTGPGFFTSTQLNPVVDTAGAYILTVSNNTGCSGTATALVTDISDSIYVTVASTVDTLTCAHPISTLSFNTNIPNALFSWDSLITTPNVPNPVIQQPGVYTVTVTSPHQLCTTTASTIIVENKEAPVISLVEFVQPTAGHSNGEINVDVNGGPEPYTHIWKLSWTVIGTWEDIYNIPAGTYTNMVQAANGCTTVDTFLLTNRPLTGGSTLSPVAWRVRPNPSPGYFHLRTDSAILAPARLSVYDSSGRLVWYQEAEEGAEEFEIDLLGASDGLYFLEIVDETQRLWQKLMVQH